MNWPVKNIPARNESPEMSLLCHHNVAQAETARHDQHAHQRQAERNFVAHHLRAGAQSAQQGIFIVRRPPSQRHAVYADGGDAKNQQESRVHVGDLKGNAVRPNYGAAPMERHLEMEQQKLGYGERPEREAVAERDHGNRCQREDDGNQRRRNVERLINVRRRQIFLE